MNHLITTPTNKDALNLANRIARLGAFICDILIYSLFLLPVFAVGLNNVGEQTSVLLLVASGLAFLAILVIQVYFLSVHGQTLGKKAFQIRIVTFAGDENPGFAKAVLLRALVPGLIGSIPYLGGVFSIVDVCFIFRDDKRCIHDFIAGTKVVDVSKVQV